MYAIIADDMEPLWDTVSGHITSALSYGDGKYTLDDIRERIEDKRMQLFIVVDEKEIIASTVTEIGDFPNQRVMTIILVGGKRMEEWIHLVNQLEDWAKDEGCNMMEMKGRRGWEKVLGWDFNYIALKKDLNEVKH